jgi:ATP-binding cassette subfamily B protein
MMLNVKMTLILLVVTLIMVIFSIHRNFQMKAVFMDNRVKIAKINSSLQDSLAGIRVVKSFANEEVERKKFRKSNLEFLDSKSRSYRMMGGYHAWNSFFSGLLYIIVMVSGGIFIAEGSLHVTDLAIYLLYINIFVQPLEVLINFTEQFQKGFAGFQRFIDILNTAPDIVDKPDAVPLVMSG